MRRVGMASSTGIEGASGATTPLTTPVAIPHIVSGAASGTATRLAGSATSGIEPNTGTSTGATPTCAAAVTASTSRAHIGPRSRAANACDHNAIPRLAAHDRRNPTECSRNGSTTKQRDRGEDERAYACGGPPEVAGEQPDRRHRDRTRNRRLPTRHRAEQHEDHGGTRQPTAQPEPPQHRRGEREHERDVAARHRGEMGQPCRAELLLDAFGERTGIAEEEPGENARDPPGSRIALPASTSARAEFATRVSGEPAPSTATTSVTWNVASACFHFARSS